MNNNLQAPLSAGRLEFFQWRQSPLTVKLVKILQASLQRDCATTEHGVFDASFTSDQLRAFEAKRYQTRNTLSLIEELTEFDDQGNRVTEQS